MKSLDFSRYALTSWVAAAMLAGCGGSQPPIGVLGTMPQTSVTTAHTAQGGSWMLPEASTSDLIYSNDGGANVYVFSFSTGKLVGTLTGFDGPLGECADKRGNVWITNNTPPEIVEYAHGGAAPIATLTESGSVAPPVGCSIDPTTGNLAVTNASNPATIAVYKRARGKATYYSSPSFAGFSYCSYDKYGNVFAVSDSEYLAELPKGSSELQQVRLNQPIGMNSIQWDDSYLAISAPGGIGHTKNSATKIYHVTVVGSIGTVTGETLLVNRHNRAQDDDVQYWIRGRTIVGPDTLSLDFWRYPKGGRPTRVIPHVAHLWGTTVSVAPR